MSTVRAVWRILLIVVLTGGLVSLMLLFMPVTFGSPRRRIAWRGFITRNWSRGLARIIGMRVKVTGTCPKPPFLLAANHLSYLDIILLQTQSLLIFVAKSEVGSWPVIGWLAKLGGTLFIDRRSRHDVPRVLNLIKAALEQGDAIVFFPEGTTSNGEQVQPFRRSLFELPASEGLPVHYATIRYQTPPGTTPASHAICWWGDMTFGDHLFNILKLPYFEAHVTFGAESIQESDRRVLANRLYERIEEQFTPVEQPLMPVASDTSI